MSNLRAVPYLEQAAVTKAVEAVHSVRAFLAIQHFRPALHRACSVPDISSANAISASVEQHEAAFGGAELEVGHFVLDEIPQLD